MKHIIIGYGEVGKALHEIIKGAHILASDHVQPPGTYFERYDVMHVCFPYSNGFKEYVAGYKEMTRAKLVIIHSTVPIGISRSLGAVHSPIRGVHPNLAKGIKTFVKYFGGKNANKAAKIFSDLGIKTKVFPKADTTEAIKLWDTTQYGVMIMLCKEIYQYCKKNKLNFEEVYRLSNKDYNEGYLKLGRPEVVRPYLKYMPGKIGGHCVIPNANLLQSKIAKQLLIENENY